MGETVLRQRPIDYETKRGSCAPTYAAAPPGSPLVVTWEDGTTSIRVKIAKRGEIVSYRQAWDAALDTFTHHALRINGVYHPKFGPSAIQIAPPEAADYRLPVPIPVEQGAIVEVVFDNSDSTGVAVGTCYAVLEIFYYDSKE